MTAVLVAHVAAGGTSGGVTTGAMDSSTANFVVALLANDSGASPVTDSKSNTFSLTTLRGSPPPQGRLYYTAGTPTVGTSHTFSESGVNSFPTICAAAFSGMLVGAVDQQNGTALVSGGTSIATGSVTPTTNGQLVLAFLATNFVGAATVSIDSGFTIIDQVAFLGSNHYSGCLAYLVQSTAAAVNPTFSWSGTGNQCAGIATFKTPVPTNLVTAVAGDAVGVMSLVGGGLIQ